MTGILLFVFKSILIFSLLLPVFQTHCISQQHITMNDHSNFEYLRALASAVQSTLSRETSKIRKGTIVFRLDSQDPTSDIVPLFNSASESAAELPLRVLKTLLADLRKEAPERYSGLVLIRFSSRPSGASNAIRVMFSPFVDDEHVLENTYYDIHGTPDLCQFELLLRRNMMRFMPNIRSTQNGQLEFEISNQGKVVGTKILKSCGVVDSDDLMCRTLESKVQVKPLPSPGPKTVKVHVEFSRSYQDILKFTPVNE
jgi:hypothetical protein